MKKILATLTSLLLVLSPTLSITSFTEVNNNQKSLTVFEVPVWKKADLSKLAPIEFDLDDLTITQATIELKVNQIIEDEIKKVLNKDLWWHPQLGIDYTIDPIAYDEAGHVMNAGSYLVKTTLYSRWLTGTLELQFIKYLEFNYPTTGTIEEGQEILDKIIQEILWWYPHAKLNIDYRITDLGDGSWIIEPVNNHYVRFKPFHFTAHQQTDLSTIDFDFVFDVDDIHSTKTEIEQFIEQTLKEKVDNRIQQGIDYQLDAIPYLANNRLAVVGYFNGYALSTSKLIKGNFSIRFIKNLNLVAYKNYGTEVQWQTMQQTILQQIKRWNGLATIGVDYEIKYFGNFNWLIQSTLNANVIFKFNFQVQSDLSSLPDLIFDLKDQMINQELIELIVAQTIENNLVFDSKLNIDYEIKGIEYDLNGRPTHVGTFYVTALPTSRLLTGSFKLRLIIHLP